MIGTKHSTENAGACILRNACAVGECSICDEAKGVTHSGAYGSKNVGTSNHKEGEIPSRRNTKISFAMIISEGLVGT